MRHKMIETRSFAVIQRLACGITALNTMSIRYGDQSLSVSSVALMVGPTGISTIGRSAESLALFPLGIVTVMSIGMVGHFSNEAFACLEMVYRINVFNLPKYLVTFNMEALTSLP